MADGLLLLAGLVLLLAGGRQFVASASQLAASLGISELAIGLTVVAFGTSAPELAVNSLAAASGSTSIAFGNVVGSNIANLSLVLGLCALTRPLLIENIVVSREIPMMLLATVAALILGLGDAGATPGSYGRSDGLMLLMIFSVFLYYTAVELIEKREETRPTDVVAEGGREGSIWPTLKVVLSGLVGLGAILLGAELTVIGARAVAEAMGVPREIIGLTIVAAGTSLPELVTSLIATRKGQTDLAVGNVVGSNIFNLMFVLGTTALIHPVDVPAFRGSADLIFMAALSFALLLVSLFRGSTMSRLGGLGFVSSYIIYMVWRLDV